MGRQIHIELTTDDERRLIEHLSERFPIRVVDRLYPADWDHETLVQSPEVPDWLIVDTRVVDLLIRSANRIGYPSSSDFGRWQIRSKAQSCIEWSRDLRGVGRVPGRGRLYLNTDPHMIYQYISAETGDDVESCFKTACRWLRRNCVNIVTTRRGLWTSLEKASR